MREWSLPSRGAWIEIGYRAFRQVVELCRSPHGERGLKFCHFPAHFLRAGSLPSRGAWIEILAAWPRAPDALVAPLTGSVD